VIKAEEPPAPRPPLLVCLVLLWRPSR